MFQFPVFAVPKTDILPYVQGGQPGLTMANPQLTAAEALTHATIGVPVRVGKM